MTFNEIWPLLRRGVRVKRKDWSGYWAWENNTIMIHCGDGTVFDIRQTDDPSFTFSNIAADDWKVFDSPKSILGTLKTCAEESCNDCLHQNECVQLSTQLVHLVAKIIDLSSSSDRQ